MAATIRLFVAIYPPPEAGITLLRTLAGVKLPPHRVVALDQLHMTLLFIGDTPVNELDRVRESVERAAAGIPGFDLAATHLRVLPSEREARLVAAETTSPSPLLELQRRLSHRLARPSVRDRGRAFMPHITLVRFGHLTPCSMPAVMCHSEAFQVSAIHLVQSRLQPAGAIHVSLASVSLG